MSFSYPIPHSFIPTSPHYIEISGNELKLLEEQLACLLSDANSEVRAAALDGVERLFLKRGVEVVKELEALGVRGTQLKHLTSPSRKMMSEQGGDAAAAGSFGASQGSEGSLESSHPPPSLPPAVAAPSSRGGSRLQAKNEKECK